MQIGSFVELIVGNNDSIKSRYLTIPANFIPPDRRGLEILPLNNKLIYMQGENVTITAPQIFEGKKFIEWIIYEGNSLSLITEENPINIQINSNMRVYAMYETLSIVTVVDIIPGLQSGIINNNIYSYTTLIEGLVTPQQIDKIESFVELELDP